MDDNKIKVPINIILLEDEKEILKDMSYEMSDQLKNFDDEYKNQQIDRHIVSPVNIIPQVFAFDNLKSVRTKVHNGNCDVLIADFKVKENPQSPKASANVFSLLTEIKNKNGLIQVIGHTAFDDLFYSANNNQLTYFTCSKKEHDSIMKIIKTGAFITKEIGRFKGDIFSAFSEIREAHLTPSLVEKQERIEIARNILANIVIPQYAPYDYLKTVFMIRSLLFRISSVPSAIFRLNSLSDTLIEELYKLTLELRNPFFSFAKHGLPIFLDLEAKGYDVIMKIDDEE